MSPFACSKHMAGLLSPTSAGHGPFNAIPSNCLQVLGPFVCTALPRSSSQLSCLLSLDSALRACCQQYAMQCMDRPQACAFLSAYGLVNRMQRHKQYGFCKHFALCMFMCARVPAARPERTSKHAMSWGCTDDASLPEHHLP